MKLHCLRLLRIFGNKHLVIVSDSLHKRRQTHCMLADHRVACKAPLSFKVTITKRVSVVRFLAPKQRKTITGDSSTGCIYCTAYSHNVITLCMHAQHTSSGHACTYTHAYTHLHMHIVRTQTHTVQAHLNLDDRKGKILAAPAEEGCFHTVLDV